MQNLSASKILTAIGSEINLHPHSSAYSSWGNNITANHNHFTSLSHHENSFHFQGKSSSSSSHFLHNSRHESVERANGRSIKQNLISINNEITFHFKPAWVRGENVKKKKIRSSIKLIPGENRVQWILFFPLLSRVFIGRRWRRKYFCT